MKGSKGAEALHSPYSMSPRRESRVIDKTSGAPPAYGAIRVIHIFAPKVIKTDVANFRALVQKLTGRPGSTRDGKKTGRSRQAVAGGGSNSIAAAAVCRTSATSTTCMRSPTSSSSVDDTSTFGIESSRFVATSANRHQSSKATADVFDQKFKTRSGASIGNSQGSSQLLFSTPASSTTSSAAAKANWFELEFPGRLHSSSTSSSRYDSDPLSRDQMLPANTLSVDDRLVSCAATDYKSSSSTSWNQPATSNSKYSSSVVVDPMQSLSGYKHKDSWSSPEASSCSSWSQDRGDRSTGLELQNQLNSVSSLNLGGQMTSSNELAFSEMEILTGLVSPRCPPAPPLPAGISTIPPPFISDYSYSASNHSMSLEHFLFSTHHHPSSSCRLSVHPLIPRSVTSEHF
ncbi:hypothetical protein R1flu_015550 [Riccia fluitans]|uniref:VQ domain-containing protein n=1 Tax=Riccia fluitans TaxID=41844 RepID=A0ABD1YME0_9MARC